MRYRVYRHLDRVVFVQDALIAEGESPSVFFLGSPAEVEDLGEAEISLLGNRPEAYLPDVLTHEEL